MKSRNIKETYKKSIQPRKYKPQVPGNQNATPAHKNSTTNTSILLQNPFVGKMNFITRKSAGTLKLFFDIVEEK